MFDFNLNNDLTPFQVYDCVRNSISNKGVDLEGVNAAISYVTEEICYRDKAIEEYYELQEEGLEDECELNENIIEESYAKEDYENALELLMKKKAELEKNSQPGDED